MLDPPYRHPPISTPPSAGTPVIELPETSGPALSPQDLLSVLDLVASGQVQISITTASGAEVVLIDARDLADLRAAATAARSDDERVVLTPRERDVLAHVAAGKSTAQVAAALGLAVGTVTAHLVTARRKYGVRTSAAAARAAVAASDGQLTTGETSPPATG